MRELLSVHCTQVVFQNGRISFGQFLCWKMNSFVVTELTLLKQFEVKAFAFYVVQCFEHSVLTYINVMKNL